jgi:hypothetical protein
MNAPMVTDCEQFRTLLRFSDDASAEVLGRMANDIPAELDDRLRALGSGELSVRDRNCMLEKLVHRPDLLHRLAEHLQEELLGDE